VNRDLDPRWTLHTYVEEGMLHAERHGCSSAKGDRMAVCALLNNSC